MTPTPPSVHPSYPDTDCVAAFVRDIETEPDLCCVHLAAKPGTPGVRQMCAPDRAACLLCAAFDLTGACFDACHCCAAPGGELTSVAFAVTRDRIVSMAVLCGLCLSLLPPGGGRVMPVTGSAR